MRLYGIQGLGLLGERKDFAKRRTGGLLSGVGLKAGCRTSRVDVLEFLSDQGITKGVAWYIGLWECPVRRKGLEGLGR